MILEGKLTVSCSDLLTSGCVVDAQGDVVSGLVVVHSDSGFNKLIVLIII